MAAIARHLSPIGSLAAVGRKVKERIFMMAAAEEMLPVITRPIEELTVHPGQSLVLNTKSRFKVVVAGRRWGKTVSAGTSIARACGREKQLIWYVAPTYAMAKTIMFRWLEESLPRKWIRKRNESELSFYLKNGTLIQLKGADKPDTLRGVGLHHLVIDEAQDIKEETWTKVLRPTLSSTMGTALIIGTPKGFTWLYDLYMLGQDPKKQRAGTWHSWQFPTITSPFIPAAEIEQARSDMDEKSFKQEFEASFETMSGRVYYQFDRHVHVQECEYDPRKPIWIGQDFNIDPMSSVIMQLQDDGTVHVVDEIVMFSSNTQEVYEELERRYWEKLNQVTIYPDPAGAYRGHGRGESDLDILRNDGAGFTRMRYRRKHPRIADRVNAVNRMLKTASGKIGLRIDHKCKGLIQSLEQTIYKEGSREVDKAKSVEHSADALGYCIELEFPVRKFVPIGTSI